MTPGMTKTLRVDLRLVLDLGRLRKDLEHERLAQLLADDIARDWLEDLFYPPQVLEVEERLVQVPVFYPTLPAHRPRGALPIDPRWDELKLPLEEKVE